MKSKLRFDNILFWQLLFCLLAYFVQLISYLNLLLAIIITGYAVISTISSSFIKYISKNSQADACVLVKWIKVRQKIDKNGIWSKITVHLGFILGFYRVNGDLSTQGHQCIECFTTQYHSSIDWWSRCCAQWHGKYSKTIRISKIHCGFAKCQMRNMISSRWYSISDTDATNIEATCWQRSIIYQRR